jgi:hypothetical protein
LDTAGCLLKSPTQSPGLVPAGGLVQFSSIWREEDPRWPPEDTADTVRNT